MRNHRRIVLRIKCDSLCTLDFKLPNNNFIPILYIRFKLESGTLLVHALMHDKLHALLHLLVSYTS